MKKSSFPDPMGWVMITVFCLFIVGGSAWLGSLERLGSHANHAFEFSIHWVNWFPMFLALPPHLRVLAWAPSCAYVLEAHTTNARCQIAADHSWNSFTIRLQEEHRGQNVAYRIWKKNWEIIQRNSICIKSGAGCHCERFHKLLALQEISE